MCWWKETGMWNMKNLGVGWKWWNLSWFNILLPRVTSFLFGPRIALLYLFVFLTQSAWILHLGLLAGVKQICSAFSNTILPSNWWSMSSPEQQSSLLSNCVVWTWVRNCDDVCQRQRHRSGSRMDATPQWENEWNHSIFPPSWHTRQMELAITAAQPQPKPWQQWGNRKPARPIAGKNAVPSK